MPATMNDNNVQTTGDRDDDLQVPPEQPLMEGKGPQSHDELIRGDHHAKEQATEQEQEQPQPQPQRSTRYWIKLSASLCCVILLITLVLLLTMGGILPRPTCTTDFNMPPANHILDNGHIRVGVDFTMGGAIAYVAPSNNPQNNLINAFDKGRQVQMSFYAGPAVYNPPTAQYPNGACDKLFANSDWSWNPIGAGDVDGGTAQILNFERGVHELTVLTRPLQWACHGVPCECMFDQQIQLIPDTPAVKVTATLINDRTDPYNEEEVRSQELPAVYVNGGYHRLFSYRGANPFGGDAAEEIPSSFDGSSGGFPWIPGSFQATEHWAAFVDDNGWGLGLINPTHQEFLGGFYRPEDRGCGGPQDGQTGYLAATGMYALPRNIVFTYEFHMVLGTVDEIRRFAKRVMNGENVLEESVPGQPAVPEIVPLPLPLNPQQPPEEPEPNLVPIPLTNEP